MKKLIFIFTLLILFTGCELKDISENDINAVIEETLDFKVQSANNYFNGYKYYLPRGFNLESKKGNNHILSSNGDTYYLYVDVVSYFHKQKIETTFDEELYFSKKISYNGTDGYIKIGQPNNDIYYVEVVYNYSKIETYVEEENLEYALKNAIRILSSVNYNDVILDTLIGENSLDYQEEIYDEFESKREDGNFLDYIEEFDVYDDKEDEVKDEDIIG